MSTPPEPKPPLPAAFKRHLLPLAGIAAIVATAAAAFAWSAGYPAGGRLTAQRMIGAIEGNGPAHPGFRRAHSKGMCVEGMFRSNGAGAALSSARVFVQREVPVLGRLSIAGGNPHAADATARVRSMALLLRSDDGQQWRTAMNSFPFFAVSTPAGFQAQTLAARPDPATGKPDPAKMAAFLEKYPQARRFQQWAGSAPWSNSWANTRYNSVNAFRFIAAAGHVRHVRWSMRPQAAFEPLDAQQREQADADFLADDLQARLAQGPLRWDLMLTVAAPDDPVDDPAQPWPEQQREQVLAGTLELTGAEPQANGACRDVNYDPLILPTGIAASDDPILAARSAVYSQSFNRREREIARSQAPEATGHGGAR
ncbi:MAG: catalase family peroxidase [Stenotrophomonas sp.]